MPASTQRGVGVRPGAANPRPAKEPPATSAWQQVLVPCAPAGSAVGRSCGRLRRCSANSKAQPLEQRHTALCTIRSKNTSVNGCLPNEYRKQLRVSFPHGLLPAEFKQEPYLQKKCYCQKTDMKQLGSAPAGHSASGWSMRSVASCSSFCSSPTCLADNNAGVRSGSGLCAKRSKGTGVRNSATRRNRAYILQVSLASPSGMFVTAAPICKTAAVTES